MSTRPQPSTAHRLEADRYLLVTIRYLSGRIDSLSEMARLSESKSQDAFCVVGRLRSRFVASRGETGFEEFLLSANHSHLMSDRRTTKSRLENVVDELLLTGELSVVLSDGNITLQ